MLIPGGTTYSIKCYQLINDLGPVTISSDPPNNCTLSTKEKMVLKLEKNSYSCVSINENQG